MRASPPRSRSEPLRLHWRLFGLSDAARTVCVLFGDHMPRQRRRKRRFRAGGRTRRFHSCRTSKRIRHHPECGWYQTQTDRGATVTGAHRRGDGTRERRSPLGGDGRSDGGANAAVPVIFPSSGGMIRANPSAKNSERVTIPSSGLLGARSGRPCSETATRSREMMSGHMSVCRYPGCLRIAGPEPVDELEHRFGVHHSPSTMVRCAQMWMGPGSSPRFSICLTVGASDSARTVRASLSTLARLMLR